MARIPSFHGGKGYQKIIDLTTGLPTTMDGAFVDICVKAIFREYDRQRSSIPLWRGKPYTDKYGRHGGALRRSLTIYGNPWADVFVSGSKVQISSRLDYAKYQRHRLPTLDAHKIAADIMDMLFAVDDGWG